MKTEEEASSPSEKSAWETAVEYGFDMSLIELNLQLTPQERCLQHDRAMNLAMEMKKAAETQINGLSEVT